MAPKRAKNSVFSDPKGMFSGMVVYLIENGVQSRRVQGRRSWITLVHDLLLCYDRIWKQRLMQMGATVEDHLSKKVTHIFAMNSSALSQQVDCERLKRFKGTVLRYQWLEDSLKRGVKEPQDSYTIAEKLDGVREKLRQSLDSCSKSGVKYLEDDESSPFKKTRTSKEIELKWAGNRDEDRESSDTGRDDLGMLGQQVTDVNNEEEAQTTAQDSSDPAHSNSGDDSSSGIVPDATPKEISLYNAPDLNRNITEIFGKLVNIYRALGDDRRSFSYYKAISVIEKLPFKIESVDQVKHLPAIGKSMQDHIQEIYTTGRLSKLEHFERDEKVRTITLFGEVWGIGPVTALKLYEKGHRTLDDLKNEDSLTTAQRVGLEFFDDIKKRIPRDEVKDMEILLQKSGDAVLPGVVVICGGSFRRGKATCGDLDIVITHPDGKSHKGFLHRYVQYLKDIKFLREDLVFNTHSIEGTDSGVDTYFGLCTYPGREHRHRIDLKVYPVDNYAFGLIAWTGNDVLNRRLRLLAESKGYRLDDTGLYLATQSSAGKKGVKYSTNLNCKSEKEVFDVLGFPWLEPHERNL